MYERNVIEKPGKPLTAADIAAVEAAIGIPLPESLRAHYLLHNGGMPRRASFIDASGDDYEFASFSTMRWRKYDHEVLFEDTYRHIVLEKNLLPAEYVPFAIDGGGNFFCVERGTGAIFYSAMDGSEALPNRGERVADDLVSFIDGMTDEGP